MTASFVYDGLGRREKKTVNGSLTEFLYDGVNPVQETSGATILANMLTGLDIDEYFARTDVPAGITSSFFPDVLGSALALADSTGAIQTEYTYEPFGRTTVTGVSNTNPFQYTGRENDGTGLYYYRARYYHPGLQRFISEDPIHFFGGDINLYGYVGNDPLKYTDPHGLFSWGSLAWRVISGVLQIGPVAILLDVLGGRKCIGGCPLNEGEDQMLRDWWNNQPPAPPPPPPPPTPPSPPPCDSGSPDCQPPPPPCELGGRKC